MGSTFKWTNFDVADLSAAELDEIALQGGVVGALSAGGYRARDNNLPEVHGYAFAWINTAGEGNRGTLVLRGLTARTRALVAQGKITELQSRFGLSERVARAVARARVSYKYEERVLKAAVAPAGAKFWSSYPGWGNGVNRWLERTPEAADALKGLSVPRIDSVSQLAPAICWAQ